MSANSARRTVCRVTNATGPFSLPENGEGNLAPRQVQFAETIHSSGNDLLSLINDILDLSKIESGMMAIEIGEVPFADATESLSRSFHQIAHGVG